MGAIHYRLAKFAQELVSASSTNEIELSRITDKIRLNHRFADVVSEDRALLYTLEYLVTQAGVVPDLRIIDTTGAGDAFIGGYLLAQHATEVIDPIRFGLEFGAWVAGRKLEGPGSRSALPKGTDVDDVLGRLPQEVERALHQKLTPFNI